MSKKYHSGSDMYKKHRDLIASIMEQADNFEDEIDETKLNKDEEELEESADHPEDCRCKMCKPSIYEGHDESDYPEEWLNYISDTEAARLMKYHDKLERGEKLGSAREDFDMISDKLSAGYDGEEKKHRDRAERAGVMGESANTKDKNLSKDEIMELPVGSNFYYNGYTAKKVSSTKVEIKYPMRPKTVTPIKSLKEQADNFEDEDDRFWADYEEDDDLWHVFDTRNGEAKSIASFTDEDQAKEYANKANNKSTDIEESADHPEDCRCKMCKPSIYEESDDDPCWEDHEQYGMKKKNGKKVPNCVPKESVDESDDETLEKAKKEIEDESELALEVAEDHGQLFDNVKHMTWFVQEVADKIKEDSTLEEKDMNTGIINSKQDLKRHIANNFSFYEDNIMRLYPEDLKHTKEVFIRFLKGQEINKEKLEKLGNILDKKIKEVGDAYDEMSNFIEMVKKFG